MSFSKVIIFACFAVLIGVPLVFRPGARGGERSGGRTNAPQLIIVTPHDEQIRYEFKRGFEDWHRRVHGSPVNVVYNVPGGTSEIRKLLGKVAEKGLTLVPLDMHYKNGRVKVLLALAKGKQAHDKRETIRQREVDRETRAAVKSRSR